MPAKLFTDILAEGQRKGHLPGKTIEAREWYRNKASAVGSVNERTLMLNSKDQLKNQFSVGKMFMFFYDAKHKKTLPVWDRVPLVFPFARAPGGFLGMNMHYLAPPLRAALMDELYNNISNKKYDETTKIKMSYQILKSASTNKYFAPTVHRYLTKHLRSRFLHVPAEQWDIALMLPTARFVNSNGNKVRSDIVWKQSRNKL